MVKARTFSGSKIGLMRYSQCIPTLHARDTAAHRLHVASSQMGIPTVANCNHLQPRATWGTYCIGISMHVAKRGRYRAVPLLCAESLWPLVQLQAQISPHGSCIMESS